MCIYMYVCSPKKQADPPLFQLPPPTKTSALKQAYQVLYITYTGTMRTPCSSCIDTYMCTYCQCIIHILYDRS